MRGQPVSRRQFIALSGGALLTASALNHHMRGAQGGATDATVRGINVDARVPVGVFNRALFSATGYAQLKVSAEPIAHDTYLGIHPAGTQQRIETMIDQAAPQPGVFQPANMFRFVDNTDDAYFDEVTGLGMEPVLLCAYDVGWLAANGQNNDPPKDPQQWADIVAQIVEHFNGTGSQPDYQLRVKYIEIWNEPNLAQFWTGTWDEYFQLFQTTADTLHARYPGVMVGGCVYSPGNPDYYGFGKAFINQAGNEMDYFIYHSYGDTVDTIRSDIALWRDYIAAHTKHCRPKIMVTESEQFYDSDALKNQYMLDRQFALIDHADTLLGWHQFCTYEYTEGSYTFGMIYGDGAAFDRNYWPYWIFRDADGNTLRVTASSPGNDDPSDRLVATRSDDGQKINLVYWLPEGGTGTQPTRFSFLLPRDRVARVLVASTMSGVSGQVIAARKVNGNATEVDCLLDIAPGTAVSLTLDNAQRVATPWVGLAASHREIPVSASFTATATVLNTTPNPISGQIGLAGLPADWAVELRSGDSSFDDLTTGEKTTVTWEVTATTATSLAYHAEVAIAGAQSTHSIPVRISVTAPATA